MKLTSLGVALALFAACGANPGPSSAQSPVATPPPRTAGVIDGFEIVSSADAWNGAMPAGAAGAYTVITGIVHGRLLPYDADNAGVVEAERIPGCH